MFKMKEMISSIIDELREELSNIDIKLNILLIREMTISSNRDRIKIIQIIYNLMLNAYHQLDKNNKIEVYVYTMERIFFVEINAKGNGILEEDFEIIKNSYYKSSDEFNKKKLNVIYSINDNLLELRGNLCIWSQPEKGVIFKLNFTC